MARCSAFAEQPPHVTCAFLDASVPNLERNSEQPRYCDKLCYKPFPEQENMRRLLVPFLLLIATLAVAQHPAASRLAPSIPKTDLPSNVRMRNADITVRRLSIPPDSFAPVSASSRDYLLISIGKSTLAAVGYGTNFEMAFDDGEMQVLQGGWQHKLVNKSHEAAQLIAVEVSHNLAPQSAICGLAAQSCQEVRFGKSSQGEYEQAELFETDTAKLFRVHLGSQVTMQQHADDRKHLIVALTPLQAHAGEDALTLEPGDTYWHSGRFDGLSNDGKSDAYMLILELKK
jgi:hypothetical protein